MSNNLWKLEKCSFCKDMKFMERIIIGPSMTFLCITCLDDWLESYTDDYVKNWDWCDKLALLIQFERGEAPEYLKSPPGYVTRFYSCCNINK